ncbi:MAG TPA: ABC transporter ATP-binding protein [Pyrinomonadaceae bacterium]|nr:ABC transporter ATP-binding protein [Pyrinomonadaceae bacterium]
MILEIENLRKSFIAPDGSRQAVVSVGEFYLEAGAQIALKGESGSGKTTFLNLIAGILQVDAGSVTIDGAEMSALNESKRDALRARKIGYIFQTFNLLQGFTALENIVLGMAFGAGADEKHAFHLLERVGLKNRADYRPRQLSVGQQQRVAVARALANRPRLVLADEPTGNLDRRRAFELLELIREVCRENETALLLVSHDREILEKFETVRDLGEINYPQMNTDKH